MVDLKQGLGARTLAVADAAAYLNVSRQTVHRLIEAGQLKSWRVSPHKIVIERESFERYCREQEAMPPHDEALQTRAAARRREDLEKIQGEMAVRQLSLPVD